MPFVAVNCGAMPENLLESELFGYQKGAFTGAVSTREGLAREADGGTLFLDEITELPLHLQVKLLRFIQEKSYRMVGGTADVPADIRLIAASNKDVEGEVKAGRFREDLFYRLNIVPIKLPPLREREGDIPLLVNHFVARYAKKFGKQIKRVDAGAMERLVNYPWPGNVRELENVIERGVILADADTIKPENLPFLYEKASTLIPQPSVPSDLSIKKAEEDIEKILIKKALDMTNGNKTKAAKLLEISHRALLYKIKEYGLL